MSHVAPDTISEFERIVGYKFQDRDLLARSLTHKSFANERRETSSSHNERLEFLGDTVLGFVIGELIYRSFPNLQGPPDQRGHHLTERATSEFSVRIPAEELTSETIGMVQVRLHRLVEPASGVRVGAQSLGAQLHERVEPVAELIGLPESVLPPTT